MSDGSLANELLNLFLPAANSAYPSQVAVGYMGSMMLKASFNTDHSVKDVKLLFPKDGMIYYANEAQRIFGSGPSGLSMKRVDSSKVPSAAHACFDSVDGDTPVANCPQGNWVVH